MIYQLNSKSVERRNADERLAQMADQCVQDAAKKVGLAAMVAFFDGYRVATVVDALEAA